MAPSDTINKFRHDDSQWIVSVGMISEGTDIPRLQVCCHLSRVKTELYFRKILGRILRTTKAIVQRGWLFTFAEPKLVEFAHRIELELPDSCIVIRERQPKNYSGSKAFNNDKRASLPTDKPHTTMLSLSDIFDNRQVNSTLNQSSKVLPDSSSIRQSIQILGRFREKVISTFDSPF